MAIKTFIYSLLNIKNKLMILLFCGLSGAGKTTLAESVKLRLLDMGMHIEIIDADEYRERMFRDLMFSKADRFENIRRLGFIANKFAAHGIITIVSAINPYEEVRNELVNSFPNVKVVHIDCPLDQLKKRDTKGLYARAALPEGAPGKIENLTGVNDPFERPLAPDVYINTEESTLTECTKCVYSYIISELKDERKRTA